MAEYIERRKAAEVLCNVICGSDRGLCISTPENCQQKKMLALYELAAADVAPVVHGRWIVTDVITCSECQHFTRSEFAGRWNYCPNCGARMDKEDEHD